MYSFERSLDRACHGASAMFFLVVAADFSGTSHSRSSNTLGTLYWRREERRVTSPSRVYFFCNRFLPSFLPPSPPPADMHYLFLFLQCWLHTRMEGISLLSLSLSLHIAPLSSFSSEPTIFSLLLPSSLSFSYRLVSFSSRHRGIQMTSDDEYGRLSRAIGPLR